MSNIIIYGIPLSPHVRTARMTAIEKGVPHTLEMSGFEDIKTPEHFAVHPFGRIPAMRHGDNVIWETQAICHYIDEAFDGPALMPSDPLGRAHVEQWLSAANDYLAATMLSRFVGKYVAALLQETEPDHQAIEEAIPAIEEQLAKIDQVLTNRSFLVGNAFTLADLRVVIFLDTVQKMPKGAGLFKNTPHALNALEVVRNRNSYKQTEVPWPFTEKSAA